MRKALVGVALIGLLAGAVAAERPPEPRKDAELVLVGTVKKVATKGEKFGGDGVMSRYVAEVAVDKVEKGTGAKAGQTVKVTWFRVTKAPSKPLAGAFGQAHGLKAKDKARFWLLRGRGKKDAAWVIIYNKDGVEKLKK